MFCLFAAEREEHGMEGEVSIPTAVAERSLRIHDNLGAGVRWDNGAGLGRIILGGKRQMI